MALQIHIILCTMNWFIILLLLIFHIMHTKHCVPQPSYHKDRTVKSYSTIFLKVIESQLDFLFSFFINVHWFAGSVDIGSDIMVTLPLPPLATHHSLRTHFLWWHLFLSLRMEEMEGNYYAWFCAQQSLQSISQLNGTFSNLLPQWSIHYSSCVTFLVGDYVGSEVGVLHVLLVGSFMLLCIKKHRPNLKRW